MRYRNAVGSGMTLAALLLNAGLAAWLLPATVALLPLLAALLLAAALLLPFVRHRDDRASQLRQEREARLRAANILDSIADAFFALDRDFRFNYVNRQAEKLLERGRADLLGKSLWVEFPDLLGTGFGRNFRRSVAKNVVAVFEEFYAPHDRWYEVHTYPSAEGLSVSFRDATERHLAQVELQNRAEQLAEADHRKDEFLAMLGHELRNPLAPVRNAVAILGMPGVDREGLAQARAMIERQVQQMTRLVDDLLDVSRIARGKIHLRRQRFDLAELVRGAAEDQRPTIARTGLTLDVETSGEAAWVEGDPARLTQVVDNLLNNAAKFTDAGGRVIVRVGVDAASRQALVTVRDTGIGIEADMLPRLFESFAQADRSLDRSRGGLGLGLALVKGLVSLHGGTVTAASAGAGCGAEFTIRLPLVEAVPVPAGPPPTLAADRRHRVLLIEDNRDAADSLRLLLELSGHEVAVAYTGTEGVEAAARFRPDVVLCDIGLPGQSGYAVARALRRRETTAAALLIALSGYGGEDDLRRSREAGFDHHLVKPVDPEEVGLHIRTGRQPTAD